MKIFLIRNLEVAQNFVETENVSATVEAEYGNTCVKGKKITLAHHVQEFINYNAPCNTEVLQKQKLNQNENVVVSHIDLDTVGGIMELYGIKPESKEFWEGAEFIDVNGPHHLHELDEKTQNLIKAYWHFNKCAGFAPSNEDVNDITSFVEAHILYIQKLFKDSSFQEKQIEEGKKNFEENKKAIEDCLVEENEHIRIFNTPRIFCGGAYYSSNQDRIVDCIISYNNTLKSITLSFADGGKKINAVEIMQKVFGSQAGGRAGIAGTPRGKIFNFEDIYKVKEELNKLF